MKPRIPDTGSIGSIEWRLYETNLRNWQIHDDLSATGTRARLEMAMREKKERDDRASSAPVVDCGPTVPGTPSDPRLNTKGYDFDRDSKPYVPPGCLERFCDRYGSIPLMLVCIILICAGLAGFVYFVTQIWPGDD
jgi:hypothetical protein